MAVLVLGLFIAWAGCGGDSEPLLSAEDVKLCVVGGDTTIAEDEGSIATLDYARLAGRQKRAGRGYFSAWTGAAEGDDAFGDAQQVDFFFFRDPEAAKQGIEALRREATRSGDPAWADQRGNLVMVYAGERPNANQRQFIDKCLRKEGAGEGEEVALVSKERLAQEEREGEARLRGFEQRDRDRELLRGRRDAYQDCIEQIWPGFASGSQQLVGTEATEEIFSEAAAAYLVVRNPRGLTIPPAFYLFIFRSDALAARYEQGLLRGQRGFEPEGRAYRDGELVLLDFGEDSRLSAGERRKVLACREKVRRGEVEPAGD